MKNASSELFVLPLIVDYNQLDSNQGMKTELLKSKYALKSAFPWMEYITRAGWISNTKHFYAQIMDRTQTKAFWLQFDVESDCILENQFFETDNSLAKVFMQQSSQFWINVRDNFQFLNDGSLIFASDSNSDNGITQLYLMRDGLDKPRQLTFGNFCVLGNSLWVDESKKTAYYLRNKGNVETHLFSCSYEEPGKEVQLTHDGMDNSVNLSLKFRKCVVTSSNISSLSKTQFFDMDSSSQQLKFLSDIKPKNHVAITLPSATLITFESTDGIQLHGSIIFPPGYVQGNRYPTVVYAYGGPHVQLARNHNMLVLHPLIRLLTTAGYVVGVVDNRGSFNRGLHFEGLLKHKMGQVEVQDQVKLVEYLVANNITDPNHVAITGWSYGGYLTLMCLAQRSDVFKVCILGLHAFLSCF
jgi:dipeptidyl-peptidase 9